jgi:hypothetical protein
LKTASQIKEKLERSRNEIRENQEAGINGSNAEERQKADSRKRR